MRFILTLIISAQAFSAILGDVSSVRILPGHITFDKNDPFYNGYQSGIKRLSGVEKKTPSQVVESFFSGSVLDLKKVETLKDEINQYMQQVMKHFCIDKFRDDLDSYNECDQKFFLKKKFQKKWKYNEFNLSLNAALDQLDYFSSFRNIITKDNINDPANIDALEALFTALEIIQGIRAEDFQRGQMSALLKTFIQAKTVFEDDKIYDNSLHASNLMNPKRDQNFYSYKELEQLKKSGQDISSLDPFDSGMWRKPKKSISSFDTSNYDRQGVKQLNKIFTKDFTEKFLDPNQVIDIVYEGDNLGGGQTVKFDAYIEGVKFKLKFITNKHEAKAQINEGSEIIKHLQGSEANVEPVVNNIAAAIGYTVDPTYFKKAVRLYISEDEFGEGSFEKVREDLIEELTEKYGVSSNAQSALNDVHIDDDGKKYILIKSVSLEQKSNELTDQNIGFFQRTGLGKTLKREHRAMYLFMALIMDVDIKDDNTKVKIVPYVDERGETKYKTMLSNSDMGASLGIGHPNLYNFNLVNNVTRNMIDLSFIRIFDFDQRFVMNFDDAKWLTRRLAQLSLKQIEKAFSYGGFPELVAKYYSQVFAKKRNQLVKALGLEGETFKDDSGRDFTIELLKEFNGTIEGYENFFMNGHLTDPENKLFDSSLENFPRYWGVSYKNLSSGDAQTDMIRNLKTLLKMRTKKLINDYITSQVMVDQSGVGFLNNGIYENYLYNYCDGNCLINAVNVGVNSFVPFRYIVENPDKDSKNPFLLLDVFRIGFYVGQSSTNINDYVNLGLSSVAGVSAGAKVFRMREYIKIKEVKSLDAYFSKKERLLLSPKEVFKSFENKVNNLGLNESFLVSEYLGVSGDIRIRSTGFYPFASLRFMSKAISLKKNLVMKTKDGLDLRYGKAKSLTFDASFNIFDFFVRFPLIRYASTKNVFSEKVIRFDKKSNFSDLAFCMKLAVNCENQVYQKRDTFLTTSQNMFNFFKLFGDDRIKTRGYTEFQDFFSGDIVKEKYYIFKTNNYNLSNLVMTQDEISSIAHINQDKELSVAVDVNYYQPAAKKYHYQKFVEKFKEILPDDIIALDTKSMKHYLGDLNATINVVFTDKLLKKFFADNFLSKMFCSTYVDFAQLDVEKKSCLTSRNSEIRRFLRKYKRAQEAYVSLMNYDIEFMKYKHLKKISKFFYDKKFKTSVVKYLTRISDKDYYKRDVEIFSSQSAFAGDIDVIKESDLYKGKADKFELLDTELVGDDILEMVNPFVYSNVNFVLL